MHLNGRSQVEQVGGEGEAARFRHAAGFLSPGLHKCCGADIPPLRRQQLELHRSDIAPRVQAGFLHNPSAHLPRPHADRRVDSGQQRLGVLRPAQRQSVDGPPAGRLQFSGQCGRPPCRRSFRHLKVGRHNVGLHRLGKNNADDARSHQRNGKDDHSEAPGNHHRGLVNGQPQAALQGTVHKSLQPPVHAGLRPGEEAVHGVRGLPSGVGQVRQMARQDQQRFDQGQDENGGQDDRQRANHPPEGAGHEKERGEGRHRREDRKDYRPFDPQSSAYRGDDPRRPLLPFGMNMLGHHDGVVNHDTDREEEGKQGGRVNGNIQCQGSGQSAHKRNRDPEGNPHGQSDIQKQRQRGKDEQQAHEAVLEQEVKPALVDLRIVVPDIDRHAGGERGDDLSVQMVLHRFYDLQHLFAGGAVDLDEGRALPVVTGNQVHILEAVAHLGNIAQTHHRAVGPAEHDDFLEIVLVVAPARGADTHLRGPGLDAAGRQIK